MDSSSWWGEVHPSVVSSGAVQMLGISIRGYSTSSLLIISTVPFPSGIRQHIRGSSICWPPEERGFGHASGHFHQMQHIRFPDRQSYRCSKGFGSIVRHWWPVKQEPSSNATDLDGTSGGLTTSHPKAFKLDSSQVIPIRCTGESKQQIASARLQHFEFTVDNSSLLVRNHKIPHQLQSALDILIECSPAQVIEHRREFVARVRALRASGKFSSYPSDIPDHCSMVLKAASSQGISPSLLGHLLQEIQYPDENLIKDLTFGFHWLV